MAADFKIIPYSKGRVQLTSPDEELLKEAGVFFSYQKKVYGSWATDYDLSGTGIYSCFSPSYSFKVGLTLEVASVLTKHGYKVVIDKELKQQVKPECHFVFEELIQPHADFTYRDYQERAIRNVQAKGRGLLDSPTSSGKSLILYGICSNIKEYSERTLIIVPRTQLVGQFYKEWKTEYGFNDVSMYSKKNPVLDEKAKVVITNYQWLVKGTTNKFESTRANEILKKGNFKAIIVDEAHSIGDAGSWISKFINKFSTPYKLGCTGTIPDEKSKYWNVVGTIGPVIFKEETVNLQNRNQIAKIKIFPFEITHNTRKRSEVPFYRDKYGDFRDSITNEPYNDGKELYEAEYKFLEKHNGANNIILDIIESLQGNSIVLVEHKEHIKYLYDNCKIENKFMITGNTNVDYRLEVSKVIDACKNCQDKQFVIFGISGCISTGISIKNLQNVVFCCGGKSLVKVCQSIGRVVRKLKADGIEETYNVIDIYHNLLFSKKHYESRCKIYKTRYNKIPKIYKHIIVGEDTQNEVRDSNYKELNEL